MILILPQIQFEAIPSKDAGEVASQSEADRSHKILGFCHKSFSLVAHMALILKFKHWGLRSTFPNDNHSAICCANLIIVLMFM